MQFIVDLLNNIYEMILEILSTNGVDTSSLPRPLIPSVK